MAQTIRLSRTDNTSWGFRLQGGKDFSAPLSILKVNGGSIAERAGLQAGDGVLKINNLDAALLRHKEAQDAIMNAGNSFELLIQRGGMRTWQPKVTPVGDAPTRPIPASADPQPVTHTSLAANSDQAYRVRTKTHNAQPTPFGGGQQLRPVQVNGGMKAIVNKQYNSPVGLYSEENIAETLSAQAEVLVGGVLGVNFKKNEKPYTGDNSEVLKMVQQMDSDPKFPSHDDHHGHHTAGVETSSFVARDAGLSSVSHPSTTRPGGMPNLHPASSNPGHVSSPAAPHTSTDNQSCCSDCGRLIVGVFVRVKGKNLHVECFKCATCGSSLKNVGYYSINEKLYCDIHARQVAVQYTPSADLEPVTVPPGGPLPSGGKLASFSPKIGGDGHHHQPPAPSSFSPSAAPINRVVPKAPMLPPSPTTAPTAPPSFASKPAASGPWASTTPAPFGSSLSSTKVGPVPFHPLRPMSHVQYPSGHQHHQQTSMGGSSASATATTPPVGGVRLFPPSLQNQAASLISSSAEVVERSSMHQVSSSTNGLMLDPLPPLAIPEESMTSVPMADYTSSSSLQEREFNNLLTELTKQSTGSQSLGMTSVESTKSSQQVVQEMKRMETYSSSTSTSAIGQYGTSGHSAAHPGTGPNRVIWPPPSARPEDEMHTGAPGGTSSGGHHHVSFAPLVEEHPVYQKEPPAKPTGFVGQNLARGPAQQPPVQQSHVQAPKPHGHPVVAPSFGGPAGGHSIPAPGSKTMGQKWTPKKGKGVFSHQQGGRVPICHACNVTIRGPFVTAMNKTWCPKDFVCSMPNCRRNLQDIGFVEEQENLVCENCWGTYLAPECDKCHSRIKAECMKAIGKFFHPACFSCAYCKVPFGNDYFYLEDGLPYCENDWNELFTTKCFGCGFPIGAGDHWVEALNNSYHTQCFKCSVCHKSLEGQGFVNKGGRPHCKAHGR